MSHYLDTSVVVSLFVPEPASQAVEDALAAIDGVPVISDYGAGEFASAISRHVRMGTFAESSGRTILDAFDRWTISSARIERIEARDIQRASQIVRRFDLKLRFPDALQIAASENRGLAIMTRDVLMAEAASALGLRVMRLA